MIYATIAAFVLFIILQIADIWTTCKVLFSAKGTEFNPVMRWLMGKIGVLPALFSLKLPIITWLGAGLYLLPDSRLDLFLGTGVGDLFYIYVVYNNYRILIR